MLSGLCEWAYVLCTYSALRSQVCTDAATLGYRKYILGWLFSDSLSLTVLSDG